jgi:hypothetical protein
LIFNRRGGQVVLNLANVKWPCEAATWKTTLNASDTSLCVVNAMNHHRVRGLLARGKAVLSETTGSTFEENMHQGVVQFAPTAELTSAALKLLKFPHLRWELEQNAQHFMTADQFNTFVPSFDNLLSGNSPSHKDLEEVCGGERESSLTQIASALLSTAGRAYIMYIYMHCCC